MKILVTGCAGFIASHLIERLLVSDRRIADTEIVGIDNFATGRKDNMDKFKDLSEFSFVEGDISDVDVMDELMYKLKPDVIVHAAASYKDPNDWETDCKVNVYGTSILTTLAVKYEVKRIVYFQTALCYGLKPMEQPITLKHPIKPEGSTYAITKTAAEQLIQLSGIDYVSLRLCNVMGDKNLSGPFANFYQRLTQGKPCFVMDTRRDFLFVEDLIDVVARAVKGEGWGPYHVGSGSDVSIKEVYDAVRHAMGLEPADVEVRPRTDDDVATILLDPSKTEKDFEGWHTKTSLQDAVKIAVEWYQTHEFGETFTHLKLVK